MLIPIYPNLSCNYQNQTLHKFDTEKFAILMKSKKQFARRPILIKSVLEILTESERFKPIYTVF